MTIYRTCRPCAKRNDCDLKRALAAAIKGHDVRSIKHHCRSFEPFLTPGQNVWAKVCAQAKLDDNGEHYFDERAVFPAVFLQFRNKLDPEFWDHIEVVIGRPISGTRATYFSCSC